MGISYIITIHRFQNYSTETVVGQCPNLDTLNKFVANNILHLITVDEPAGLNIDMLIENDIKTVRDALDIYLEHNEIHMFQPPVIINYFDTDANKWFEYELENVDNEEFYKTILESKVAIEELPDESSSEEEESEEDCPVCHGTCVSNWGDDVEGPCMECCCPDCGEKTEDCTCEKNN